MIDTLQSAVLPKGMAQDVVVGDCTHARTAGITVEQASVHAPTAGAAGPGRPAAYGSFNTVRAPRPWVAGAEVRAIRC